MSAGGRKDESRPGFSLVSDFAVGYEWAMFKTARSHRGILRPEVGLTLGLFALTLALYWPARTFGYINLDDFLYVAENPMVLGGLNGAGIRQAFTTVLEQWWLPLLWISYMADIAAFGMGPHGHHLTNVVLHAANAGLLFWVLFRMTGSRWPSFFAAALFAWHPTRVEAVAWIAARKDVLSGLFFILALWAYARHAEQPSARRMRLVAAAMLAGLMSKAILVVLPPILLLLDAWPLRRARWPRGAAAWAEWRPLLAEKWPVIGLAAVFAAINLGTHTTGRGEGAPLSIAERLAMIAPNYFDYVQNVALPLRLNIVYPESEIVVWPFALLALAVLLGATWTVWRWRERWPYGTVGWLWFLVALFPIVRGVRLGLAQYANRWSYLPLIGLGIALAWTAAEWSRSSRRRQALALAAGGAVLALCLAGTRAELPRWRNSLTVFRRAAALAPDSHFAQNSLGLALLDAGQADVAADHVRRASELDPANAGYRANLGIAMLKLNRPADALPLLDEAIRIKGDVAIFHNNRGKALAALGRAAEAREAYEAALRLEPAHAEAHYNLGFQFYEAGLAAEALPHFQIAIRGRPAVAPMWFNLGMAYAALGRYAEAEPCVARALELEPDMPSAAAALLRIRLLRPQPPPGPKTGEFPQVKRM